MIRRYPLTAAFTFHYLAYIIMQTLALLAETRRGPSLSDFLHRNIPTITGLEFINNTVWFYGLLLSLLGLSLRYKPLAINYLRIGGVISILRGVCIYVTTLGPPISVVERTPEIILSLTPSDINLELLVRQWLPIDLFFAPSNLSAVYLTQDLVFSGHTTSTFLFLLIFRDYYSKLKTNTLENKIWQSWFVVYHIIVVLALVFSHEHYTIDILIAYLVVYACWHFFKTRNWLI